MPSFFNFFEFNINNFQKPFGIVLQKARFTVFPSFLRLHEPSFLSLSYP
ncbi:hypothetical protein HMPREF1554_01696 [Porphyromonas gingivalis F0569]|nr:hypothetical protein HMPREF1554_01696 [Porphyromonas gingivalis F0569]